MPWSDMFGHEHDEEPPSYDQTNGVDVNEFYDGVDQPALPTRWTDRAGKVWLLTEMSKLHLENCIDLLEARPDDHFTLMLEALRLELARRP
jgi:hypothetical protein